MRLPVLSVPGLGSSSRLFVLWACCLLVSKLAMKFLSSHMSISETVLQTFILLFLFLQVFLAGAGGQMVAAATEA